MNRTPEELFLTGAGAAAALGFATLAASAGVDDGVAREGTGGITTLVASRVDRLAAVRLAGAFLVTLFLAALFLATLRAAGRLADFLAATITPSS